VVDIDVIERKRTENTLGEMTRKLIESQEQERGGWPTLSRGEFVKHQKDGPPAQNSFPSVYLCKLLSKNNNRKGSAAKDLHGDVFGRSL